MSSVYMNAAVCVMLCPVCERLAGKSNFTKKNNDKSLCCIEFLWCGSTENTQSKHTFRSQSMCKNLYAIPFIVSQFHFVHILLAACAMARFFIVAACVFSCTEIQRSDRNRMFNDAIGKSSFLSLWLKEWKVLFEIWRFFFFFFWDSV